jgi:hypothetical protein
MTKQQMPFSQHDRATAHTIFYPIHYNNKTCSEASTKIRVFSFSPAEFQQAMNSIYNECGTCQLTDENYF